MRDLLQKLNNLRRKYGAAEALRLLARSLFRAAEARLGPGLRDRAAVEGLLRELRAGGFERVVLRRGGFGWHTPLVQRAQQLARAMGRRGCLVLYEAAPPHERLRGAEKLGEGLWLVNLRSPRLRRTIERAVCDSAKPRYVMAADGRALTVRDPDGVHVSREGGKRVAETLLGLSETRPVRRSESRAEP